MTARDLAGLLRRAPNINHARLNPVRATEVVVPEAVARGAAEAIDQLTDLLISLHAYHDVPGERDPVLDRIFQRGAGILREMGAIAVLDDPKVCAAMKTDISVWLSTLDEAREALSTPIAPVQDDDAEWLRRLAVGDVIIAGPMTQERLEAIAYRLSRQAGG